MEEYSTVESIALYVSCVCEPDDIIEIRTLPSVTPPRSEPRARARGKRDDFPKASELANQAMELAERNAAGQNIYVGANPRVRVGGRKNVDVKCARCLFVDFDNTGVEEVLARIHSAGLPDPTLLLHSGHGVHAYWRLKSPMFPLGEWQSLQKQAIAVLQSDPRIHDPARIMRLPGFENCKSEPRAKCRIIEAIPSRRFDLEQLKARLDSACTSHLEERGSATAVGVKHTSTSQDPDNDCISAVPAQTPCLGSPECRESSALPESSVCSVPTAESSVCSVPTAESSVCSIPTAESSVCTEFSPAVREQIALAIVRTLPTDLGDRHDNIFDLARELQAIPGIKAAQRHVLKEVFRRWHSAALPYMRDKCFETNWFKFLESWSKVKHPVGEGPLDDLFAEVVDNPLPEVALRYHEPRLQLLVALCVALQKKAGNGAFFLACREVGRLLKIGYKKASLWLRGLVAEHVLVLVERGSRSKRLASTYRCQPAPATTDLLDNTSSGPNNSSNESK